MSEQRETETDLAAKIEHAAQRMRELERERRLADAAREPYKPWVFELAQLHGLQAREVAAICDAAFAREKSERDAEMLEHSRTLAMHVARQTAALEAIAAALSAKADRAPGAREGR